MRLLLDTHTVLWAIAIKHALACSEMPLAARCRMPATEGGIVPGRVQAVTALPNAAPGPPGSTAFHFDSAISDLLSDLRASG